MSSSDLAPGALLNDDRPCLDEGQEYITNYNDTPELAFIGKRLPLRAAIDALRPDLVRADELIALYADESTWFGMLERDIIEKYILPMTVQQKRFLGEVATHVLPIAHGFRRNRSFVEVSATAPVGNNTSYKKFDMRRYCTYMKWESYGKIDECFYHNGDICIVAEPFCILPCGLMYCYDGRSDSVFLLNYDTGRAVEVDYGDEFPFISEYWPRSHMFDDVGQEHAVERKFVGQH